MPLISQITAIIIILCLNPKMVFCFSIFLTSSLRKENNGLKRWLGKYYIIIITIFLRKVACSLNIQHLNYNFHKDCRTVIINNTIISGSIRENRLLGEWGEKSFKSLCSNQNSRLETENHRMNCTGFLKYAYLNLWKNVIMIVNFHRLIKRCLCNFSFTCFLFIIFIKHPLCIFIHCHS